MSQTTQNNLIAENTSVFKSSVGEHIGYEAGAKMVKTYYDAHPDQAYSHFVGRDIIEKILAQPGCAGLGIYPGYNEAGVRQLVFIGVDAEGKQILSYPVIDTNGAIKNAVGLVVDKIISPDIDTDSVDWSWF